MKKYIFVIITIIFISNNSCDKEDICKISHLADLLLQDYNDAFLSEESDTKFYSISHTILNSIGDLAECSVDTASENNFNQTIIYSENSDFQDAVIADISDMTIKKLSPAETANINDKLGFTVDGYYQISSAIDYYNTVQERDESNNDNHHNVGALIVAPDEKIIHITGTNKKPKTDQSGKPVYLKRIATEISYH